ncbi:MAG: hypothetical protein M3256_13235 [Actinomycetota bacterium]|nr:hypothetical protein [Actinomycetota bacterium]
MTPIALDMRLLSFFPADHATAAEGKLYVNGAYWNRLAFPTFPQVVPALALVAVLEVPFKAYHAEHTFVFGMEDSDGRKQPLRIEGNFRVGAGADMNYGDPTVMPVVVPVHNLVVSRPGNYSFIFAVDGEELGRYPVRAIQVPLALRFDLGSPPPAEPESEAS